ncbi:MAG: hypothetical protein JWQ21_4097 [Herminiimonas sp.]|nr:hypothetical protein [Herminiimonas sp.]
MTKGRLRPFVIVAMRAVHADNPVATNRSRDELKPVPMNFRNAAASRFHS